MYEMITGRRPFVGSSPLEIMSQTVSKAVARPSLYRPEMSDAMERVVLTALAKNPRDRYQDTEEFDHHLTAAAVGRIPDDARPCRTRVGLPSVSPQPETAASVRPVAANQAETAALDAPPVASPPGVSREPATVSHKPTGSRAVATPRGRVGRSSAPLVVSPLLVLFLLGLGGAAYYLFFYEDPLTIVEHESRVGDSPADLGADPEKQASDPLEEGDLSDESAVGDTVKIWLEISPPNSVVLLNGEPIDSRPLVVDRSEAPILLEVSSPGHVSEQRRITPSSEQTLKFRLKRKGAKRRGGSRR
jgi:hypothetical protein